MLQMIGKASLRWDFLSYSDAFAHQFSLIKNAVVFL